MRLTTNEVKVLSVLQLEADAPLSVVQKRSKLPLHSVHYALKRLEEREVIWKLPFIDVYRLGFIDYGVLLALNTEDRKVHSEFQRLVGNYPGVSYIAELGGEFQYKVSITTTNLFDLQKFLDLLVIKFGQIFFQRAVSTHLGLHDFPLLYLLGDNGRIKSLSWGFAAETVEYDSIDRKILNTIVLGRSKSNREMAREIGMPGSTFEFRLRRLREKKVVCGYRYIIDVAKLGIQVYLVLLFTRGLSADLRERLRSFSSAHPHIRFLMENMGGWDFELGVETFSAREMSEVTLDIYEKFGKDLLGLKVLPVFNHLKIETRPF